MPRAGEPLTCWVQGRGNSTWWALIQPGMGRKSRQHTRKEALQCKSSRVAAGGTGWRSPGTGWTQGAAGRADFAMENSLTRDTGWRFIPNPRGNKGTQAARWQVLPRPRGSARSPQHFPQGRQGEALLWVFPAALLQLFQSCPQARGCQRGTAPSKPCSPGRRGSLPGCTLRNSPLGDFGDAVAAVCATLSHCQLGCSFILGPM